jgi:hypothetical protein
VRRIAVLVALTAIAVSGCGGSHSVGTPWQHAVHVRYDCLGPSRRERLRDRRRHEVSSAYTRCRKTFDARRLVGLGTGAAAAIARRLGLEMRPVVVNGRELYVTGDLHPQRIDVELAHGRVVRVDDIG